MPVEGAIPQLAGIDMYGNSIPAGSVGGDVFEYINFQQRYNIDARIARACKLSKEYIEPLAEGASPRNEVDVHVQWLQSKPSTTPADITGYRKAKSSEQLRVAENLRLLIPTVSRLGSRLRSLSLNGDQLDLEDERRVGRDDGGKPRAP